MLIKLIKHEMRAMLNKIPMIAIISLGMALLIRIFTLFDKNISSIPSLFISFMFMTVIFVIGLAGLNFYALFSSVSRFQKNLFGDEGYLMHTLPVPSYYHIITKFVAGLITYLIFNVLTFISMIIAFLGTDDILDMVNEINNAIKVVMEYPLTALTGFITVLSAYCALIFCCYTCVSISSLVSKGKKGIEAVLAIASLILNNVFITIITQMIDSSNSHMSIESIMLVYALYFILVAVGLFFASNAIIKRNLNLE